MAHFDERNGFLRRFYLLTGVEMCPITKGEMPQYRTLRRLPLLRPVVGLLSTLTLAALMGFWGMIEPQHAAASHRVLDRCAVVDASTLSRAQLQEHVHVSAGSMVRSQGAQAPAAAVSSTPNESQHPATPLENALETGEGSIEAGDDLNDFDDFAYHLRVVFDGAARLNREVERGVSLGGRAVSRLEDNRSDKPPRG
jgi:hypothetical protein